jgi:hypothetical protein
MPGEGVMDGVFGFTQMVLQRRFMEAIAKTSFITPLYLIVQRFTFS